MNSKPGSDLKVGDTIIAEEVGAITIAEVRKATAADFLTGELKNPALYVVISDNRGSYLIKKADIFDLQ